MPRILVIDDSPLVLGLMRTALEEAGFQVETAAHGSEGLERIEPFSPHVVISDLEMPEVDGIEIVRRLRGRVPVTPVLILTEHGDVPLVVQAMREGAFGYMRKGQSADALVEEIRAALRFRELFESHRRLEEANRRYQQQLEQMVEEKTSEILKLQRVQAQTEKLGALGLLLAGVAHEISSPLAAIRGNVERLQEPNARLDDENFLEAVGGISRSAERIARLLARLKRLRHPGSERGFCDVRTGLDQVELLCRPQLVGTAELTRQIDVELTEVGLNEDDFVLVISNLVINASHAVTPGRGRIDISITRSDEGGAVIKVSDNGSGISPEIQGKVFDPFFTTKEQGQGLGLHLVHQTITASGGTIAIDSEVGRGTSFVIRLPERPPSIAATPVEMEPKGADEKGL